MSNKLNFKVNGNSYEVIVDDINADPIKVLVNGKDFKVEINDAAADAATLSTLVTDTAPAAKAAKPTPGAAAANAGAITAPMPGTILEIMVKPGDNVAVGMTICSLEAMKMKNMIKSPRAGKVDCVEVTAGQKVGYGAVIIRFA
jgi:biotin carboxyl carrier protein